MPLLVCAIVLLLLLVFVAVLVFKVLAFKVLEDVFEQLEPLFPEVLIAGYPVVDGLQGLRVQPVEPLPPFVAHVHGAHLAEHAKVPRNVRLGQAEELHKIVDRPLALGEGIQDFPAARLGHRVERICCGRCPCHAEIVYPYGYALEDFPGLSNLHKPVNLSSVRPMDTIIQTVDLHKHFGRVRALDGLNLEVQRGEIHGFLGPNGAGKSTTLRVLLGLAGPRPARPRVLGLDPWTQSVELHRRLAYVPGDVRLWPNISGGETIDLLSRLRGGTSDAAAYRQRKARLCEALDFDPGKKGRAYSKGNRQKVALIAALATDAEIYLLDEPTSGLDPLMEAVFRREVLAAVDRGATVLLSSHILSEVEILCHRVSIIRAGQVVDGGTLDSLRHLTRSEVSFAADGVDTRALGSWAPSMN